MLTPSDLAITWAIELLTVEAKKRGRQGWSFILHDHRNYVPDSSNNRLMQGSVQSSGRDYCGVFDC